jgi:hypothetical protein
MNNRLTTDDQYEELLIEGTLYLKQYVPKLDMTLLAFSYSMCQRMIEQLGPETIISEFRKNEYEDPQFVSRLTASIEYGVPVFIIQANLYDQLINTNKLLPVVTAINFSLAQGMATIFNKLNLLHSTRPCVYANSALIKLVNRTMGRFIELNKAGLNKFAEVLLEIDR